MCHKIRCDGESLKNFSFQGELNKTLVQIEMWNQPHLPFQNDSAHEPAFTASKSQDPCIHRDCKLSCDRSQIETRSGVVLLARLYGVAELRYEVVRLCGTERRQRSWSRRRGTRCPYPPAGRSTWQGRWIPFTIITFGTACTSLYMYRWRTAGHRPAGGRSTSLLHGWAAARSGRDRLRDAPAMLKLHTVSIFINFYKHYI